MDFSWISVVCPHKLYIYFQDKWLWQKLGMHSFFCVIYICESWLQKYEVMFDYENQI